MWPSLKENYKPTMQTNHAKRSDWNSFTYHVLYYHDECQKCSVTHYLVECALLHTGVPHSSVECVLLHTSVLVNTYVHTNTHQ